MTITKNKLHKTLVSTVLAASILTLTACSSNPLTFFGAPADSSVKTSATHYQPTNANSIKIFEEGKPKQAYKVIGKVSVDETTFFVSRSLEAKYSIMKDKAAKMGGNAVIDIKEDMAAMTGVVVRYT